MKQKAYRQKIKQSERSANRRTHTDVVARKAEADGGKTLTWFHKYIFEKFGMRCITLASWYDVNTQLQYAM